MPNEPPIRNAKTAGCTDSALAFGVRELAPAFASTGSFESAGSPCEITGAGPGNAIGRNVLWFNPAHSKRFAQFARPVRITFHVSRFTFHVSRSPFHAPRFTRIRRRSTPRVDKAHPMFSGHSQAPTQQPVAGDKTIRVLARDRLVPIFPTGALHNEPARGHIPQSNAAFDVGIKAPGRHVG